MNNEEYNWENNGVQPEKKSGVSLKTAGVLLALIVLVLIFIMIFIRGCSVSKEVGDEEVVQTQEEVNLVEDTKTNVDEEKIDEVPEVATEDTEEAVTDTSESVSETEETSSTESIQDSTEISESEDSSEEGDTLLKKCEVPILGDSLETSVMVAGKGVYKYEGVSYVYIINLIFPNGEKYDIVKYPCSRKVYDAVALGDTVTATYQLDEEGIISVTSIFR